MAIGVSYSERRGLAVAVGVPMLHGGSPLERGSQYVAESPSEFPYVSGLFVYREGPAVHALLNSLPPVLELLVIFGQGIAHPRGFGMASHIGVLADVPTIGVTRKRLWGKGPEPAPDTTEPVLLRDNRSNLVGVAMRLSKGGEVIHASPGHRTDIESVLEFLSSISALRAGLPESLALAQEAANRRAFTK
ncbi:endonuclease V [Arthrobacter sp. 92]|uniref:endonuclease V n=1 Tax=Arthrobacter sp. 92 TaxID=3418175 RepID=UPI003CFBEAF2